MSRSQLLLGIIENPASSLAERIAAAHELARIGDERVPGPAIEILAGQAWHRPHADAVATARPARGFLTSPYLVTVGEFAEFIDDGGYEDVGLWSSEGWRWREDEKIEHPRFWDEAEWEPYLHLNHPVVGVSYFEADAYANFREMRLPSEVEWERLARGDDGRLYPWGDEWREEACGHREFGPRCTLPVGLFPSSVSPFGVHDLVGSVWQWLRDEKGASGPFGAPHLCAGGAWNNKRWSVGCGRRNAYPPTAQFSNLGFRLVG